jgi:pyroglutamyl-peptidase
MKILVSGFEPFDGDEINPSAELLNWLLTRELSFELVTILLPVTFDGAFQALKQTIELVKPDVVVATGLAKNRSEITVERIGINWVDARIPDNAGITLAAQKIVSAGPDGIFSRLPLMEMIEASRAVGVPAKLSTSAGEYVCNHVLYLLLQKFPKLSAGFVHLPLAPNFLGVEEMLKVCATYGGHQTFAE